MKIDRLETHDRLLHFKKEQSLNLVQGIQDCLKKNDLAIRMQKYSPYIYIFAHPRTAEDGITKKMIWQPRLTKPKAQTNSYLYRADSNTDIVEICWHLPPRELWEQFKKGNVTEDEIVRWSINQFLHYRQELEAPYPDDFSDTRCKFVYEQIAKEMDEEKQMKKIYEIQSKEEYKEV